MLLKTNLLKITFTKNNIFLNLKLDKKKIFTLSSGFVGFQGSQRFTKDAFKRLIKLIFRVLKKKKITKIILILKGLAFFFDLKKMAKTCQVKGIKLKKVVYANFLAHNGCRSSKKQRLKKLPNFILP